MIEIGRRPVGRAVTEGTIGGETGRDVIGVFGSRIIAFMAPNAGRCRTRVSTGVTIVAGHLGMRARQWE